MFYYQFRQDHSRVDLIWNHKTREELREALEAELRAFNIDRDLGGLTLAVSWNHVEFEVKYESLSEELKIGGNYVRLLLEQGMCICVNGSNSFWLKSGFDTVCGILALSSCALYLTSVCVGLMGHDLREPSEFFYDLYHRFLLSTSSKMRNLCLQAMAIVYQHYYAVIGPFADTSFLVHMLNTTLSKLERDHLIQFIDKV